MERIAIKLSGKKAEGFIIPLGPVNLVFAKTNAGMIACGAFDVMALDKYGYPAVKMRSADGKPLGDVDGLLSGLVREANTAARKRDISIDMSGKQALELL
jgi:uncharacterized protein YunC (DUF1805 family)